MTPGGSGQPAEDGGLWGAIETFSSFAGARGHDPARRAEPARLGLGLARARRHRVPIVTTANQDSPLSDGLEPLLGVDVCEHAYYVDYEHRRDEHVDAWLKVVDWRSSSVATPTRPCPTSATSSSGS